MTLDQSTFAQSAFHATATITFGVVAIGGALCKTIGTEARVDWLLIAVMTIACIHGALTW